MRSLNEIEKKASKLCIYIQTNGMIQWTEKVIWYNGLLDILFMSELGRKHGAWSCTESHRDKVFLGDFDSK